MAIPILALMGGGMMGMGLMQSFPPLSNALAHATYSAIPNQVMPVGDTVTALYRGVIDESTYDAELVKQGYNSERREWIRTLGENLLGAMELINLHRRGIITQDELETRAEAIRWSKESITDLMKVSQVIPSASDIISFAVREVYTPEIAEAFGQFEGYEAVVSQAAADLEATGMTEETFKKFWGAHWFLPSVQQGYEMLHRDVIDSATLDRLMVAADIMPFWRDKLKAISYVPYTRVDVRRMHKLGIFTRAEVLRAYMDLGYDEEKAENMTKFTLAYNAGPESSETTAVDVQRQADRDLTKTDVINGYRDGLLTEDETTNALLSLGYDENETAYYIARVEYNKETEQTDRYLQYYHDAYVRNVMTYNEIIDKLGALNLPAKRVERLFDLWDLEKEARSTKPTKSELLAFVRKGTIDTATCRNELKGLGYPEKYISWYMATV